MPPKISIKDLLAEFLIKNLPSFLISLLLFIGGIIILYLRIPGWSLFLGLPTVQIGIVLLIFTFEAVSRKRSALPTEEYHFVSCLVCNRQTQAPKYIKKRICDDCQVKIAQRIKTAALAIYLLITVPLTLILMKETHGLRQKAAEPPRCETGVWVPEECRCGAWQKDFCSSGGLKRLCDKKTYCCSQKGENWTCVQIKSNFLQKLNLVK